MYDYRYKALKEIQTLSKNHSPLLRSYLVENSKYCTLEIVQELAFYKYIDSFYDSSYRDKIISLNDSAKSYILQQAQYNQSNSKSNISILLSIIAIAIALFSLFMQTP